MEEKQTYIIATIVENKPGVLYEVSNLFRRRSFNIESISVGSTEQADLARMSITVSGESDTIEQVVKQLSKLINVIKVTLLNPSTAVIRELALIKIVAFDSKTRSDIIQYANIFRGHILDVSPNSVMVEVTGDSKKIDAFIALTVPFGLKEVARTGITALARGGKAIKE
jgi:acetolactate synthase-1/3 small subunit